MKNLYCMITSYFMIFLIAISRLITPVEIFRFQASYFEINKLLPYYIVAIIILVFNSYKLSINYKNFNDNSREKIRSVFFITSLLTLFFLRLTPLYAQHWINYSEWESFEYLDFIHFQGLSIYFYGSIIILSTTIILTFKNNPSFRTAQKKLKHR